MLRMARAATTADAFNAVAEPRRRQILDVLAAGERPVGELVDVLGLAQPQVSKHLRVLREVGAVDVRDEGRRRLYRVNGRALKPIHDAAGIERLIVSTYQSVSGTGVKAVAELEEQWSAEALTAYLDGLAR